MRMFQHDAGVTEIPVNPQRIVSLNDIQLTIPIIELGVFPVGSAGRLAADGTPYLRASLSLTGVDFSTSDIAYVGSAGGGGVDLEAIAALEPDLIINNSAGELNEQLSQIAPTIVLAPFDDTSGLDHLRMVADAVGVLDRHGQLRDRLEWQLSEARRIIPDAADITVSLLYAFDGSIIALGRSWGSMGYVLQQIGFAEPVLFDDPAYGDSPETFFTLSAERLQDIDGDFIIDSYNNSVGRSPDDARAELGGVLPGWCDFLHACRNNQYIAIPRDDAYAFSFRSFDLMLQTVVTAVGGRGFVPYDRP
jgi:iron complex transport system substrate-binding protein